MNGWGWRTHPTALDLRTDIQNGNSSSKRIRRMPTGTDLTFKKGPNFHTIQTFEARFGQYAYLRESPAGVHVLVAVARQLGAHSPTSRLMGQTYQIAALHWGMTV
jgi:hypothetical protein